MLKKLGLSAALIFASVAFAQPAAMAANWNNNRGGNNYQSGDRFNTRNNDRNNRDFRDSRNSGQYGGAYGARFEQQRFAAPAWRGYANNGFRFTVRVADRDHDRDWR